MSGTAQAKHVTKKRVRAMIRELRKWQEIETPHTFDGPQVVEISDLAVALSDAEQALSTAEYFAEDE